MHFGALMAQEQPIGGHCVGGFFAQYAVARATYDLFAYFCSQCPQQSPHSPVDVQSASDEQLASMVGKFSAAATPPMEITARTTAMRRIRTS